VTSIFNSLKEGRLNVLTEALDKLKQEETA
jgi:hypothetical protein